MTNVKLSNIEFKYSKEDKTFYISETQVPFDTTYILKSPTTNNEVEFTFTHSTGPEFDPDTRWIYKSDNGLKLEVCNHKLLTQLNASIYLEGKLRR